MRRFLLDNDASSGGGGGDAKPEPTEKTTTENDPAPPPAAKTVSEGTVTEETLRLQKDVTDRDSQIAELKKQLKDRDSTSCEFQDKLAEWKRPAKVEVKDGTVDKKFVLGKFKLGKT